MLTCHLSRILFTYLSLLALLLASPVLAAAKCDVGKLTTDYYLIKDPTTVGNLLKCLKEEKIRKEAVAPLSGFMAALFIDNPSQVEKWVKEDTFTGNLKEVLELSLWLSGHEKLIPEVFKERPAFLDTPKKDLMNIEINNPAIIDMMWGAFFASGNTDYVKRIIDILQEGQETSSKNTFENTLIFSAAVWSLVSNMKQHKAVNTFVEDQVKDNTKYAKVAKDLIEQKNLGEKN